MTLHTIPISHVAGVGPARQRDLARLGIFTVEDLICYFPFRHEDRSVQTGQALLDGTRVTIQVTIESAPGIRYKGKRSIVTVAVKSTDGISMIAVWFNRPFLREQLHPEKQMILTGIYDAKRRSIVVSHYEFTHGQGSVHSNRLVPIYEVRGELTPKILRSILTTALRQFEESIPEILPHELMQKYQLLSRKEAIKQFHLPKSGETLRQARRRLVFEEFFLFQLKLQAFRQRHRYEQPGIAHRVDKAALEQFIQALPYPLTQAQRRVCREIVNDMRSSHPMNRLLQGDVGSGKTIVSFMALYVCWISGYQSALMVPTEILAEQHYESATSLLSKMGIRCALLVSGLKEKARREVLAQLNAGEIDVVIGTHALLQEGVQFQKLGLVITDEQHRFGVHQRAIFRQKGHHSDVLFMSATPIPRTLAMSVFGDLDVSIIDEMPAGRKPIHTYWISPEKESRAITFIRTELAKSRQAYVVCPLVDESEHIEGLENAVNLYARLQDEYAGFKVGLMHGRLASKEKDDIMRRFHTGEIQVLVSTTVIEVGVNVPNATVMMIYNADRFGLAQLHQLRGRVGRGEHASTCILMADPVTETGQERLKAMVETQNGFELAEKDLELRGPGEFFGHRQSGMPDFRIGSLIQDAIVMKVAKEESTHLLSLTDFWLLPAYGKLVEYLKQEEVLEAPLQD